MDPSHEFENMYIVYTGNPKSIGVVNEVDETDNPYRD